MNDKTAAVLILFLCFAGCNTCMYIERRNPGEVKIEESYSDSLSRETLLLIDSTNVILNQLIED